jgi:hypothetical protein
VSNEGENGNGSAGDGGDGEHPLKIAVDFNDWLYARERLNRVLVRLGGCLPPSGPGPAAELSQVIAATDGLLDREREVWETIIRPRLKKFEGAPIPPLTFL